MLNLSITLEFHLFFSLQESFLFIFKIQGAMDVERQKVSNGWTLALAFLQYVTQQRFCSTVV